MDSRTISHIEAPELIFLVTACKRSGWSTALTYVIVDSESSDQQQVLDGGKIASKKRRFQVFHCREEEAGWVVLAGVMAERHDCTYCHDHVGSIECVTREVLAWTSARIHVMEKRLDFCTRQYWLLDMILTKTEMTQRVSMTKWQMKCGGKTPAVIDLEMMRAKRWRNIS